MAKYLNKSILSGKHKQTMVDFFFIKVVWPFYAQLQRIICASYSGVSPFWLRTGKCRISEVGTFTSEYQTNPSQKSEHFEPSLWKLCNDKLALVYIEVYRLNNQSVDLLLK